MDDYKSEVRWMPNESTTFINVGIKRSILMNRILPSQIPDLDKVQLKNDEYELLEKLIGFENAKELAEPVPDISNQFEFTEEEMKMILFGKV